MARLYSQFVAGEHSYSRMIEHPAITRLLPNLAGARVLDAGCGAGHSTLLLEQFHPRRIVGIDVSPAMVDLAQEGKRDAGSAADFAVADVELFPFPAGSFELVFSSGVTHYLESLRPFADECARVLVPGGQLLLSIIHPVYSAQYPLRHEDGRFPTDDEWIVRYLDPSPRSYVQPWIEFSDQEPFLVQSTHHTFSDYVTALLTAGFAITALDEPAPPPLFRDLYPGRYEAYVKTPTFAAIRATRA
jgi:SAM-dependent methyltransferase